MVDRRHLSVVRSPEEEHAAKSQVLREIAGRVPHRMEKSYAWDSEQADNLFHAINQFVANGMTLPEIEQIADLPDVIEAYLNWLEVQHR